MKSILQNERECFLSAYLYGKSIVRDLEKHHVFGGANRKLSEKYGLWVWLTHDMHNEPPQGVHHNRNNRQLLQEYVQKKAMQEYRWTEKDFMEIFGKNYIDESGLDIWPEEEQC